MPESSSIEASPGQGRVAFGDLALLGQIEGLLFPRISADTSTGFAAQYQTLAGLPAGTRN
jgi:hypothetical protein